MSHLGSNEFMSSVARICIALSHLLIAGEAVIAADDAAAKRHPIGQFLTVTSPVDDSVFSRISFTALKLQHQAAQEDCPAILVLQIEPGTSQFHHIQGLAKFLTSSQIPNVTTVAWVPSTVTGSNAVIALACKQIVMDPDAELGDIGRGKPLDRDEEQAVLALAQKRHNIKVNAAIVRKMMDPQEQLWWVRLRSTEEGKDELESRVVTKEERDNLRKSNVAIEKTEIVKDVGELGTFKGSAARALDILVSATADSRSAVAANYGLQREALREPLMEQENRKVRLIKIDGVIDSLQKAFITRQIDRATAEEVQSIVFQIDSAGGLNGHLNDSATLAESIASLDAQKIRTIAYIPKEATGGAAIIALGCDEIYMLPNARLGDVKPGENHRGHPIERDPERELSWLRTTLKHLAEEKHRPIAVCQAMADRSVKVFQVTHRDNGRVWFMSDLDIHATNGEWIQGNQISEANGELLLAVNASRAHDVKIAEPSVADFDDFKDRIGFPPRMRLVAAEKTWVDHLVYTLTRPGVVILLIILGIALIYLELHFMTGILGILAVLCFSLFFWSSVMGGTAGWLEVVLFVLGIGCLALEIFVVPGFGVFGISGIVLVLASLVMAGHSWTFDTATNIEELVWHTGQVLMAFGVVAVFGVCIARFLPSLPGFEAMVLGPPGSSPDEPRLRIDSQLASNSLAATIAIGDKGIALTMLRPSGKAQFANHVLDVISEGPFISAEAELEVISVTGNRVIVRQA